MWCDKRMVRGIVSALVLVWAVIGANAQPDPMVEMAAEALAVTVDQTGDKWFEMVVAQPDDPDEQAFVDWLVARPDIASAVVDGDAVEAKTVAGITVRFGDYQPGVHGDAGASPAPVVRHREQPRLAMAPPALPLSWVPREIGCIGDLVPAGKALIIDTEGDIIDDPDRHIQRMLEYAGYRVVEYRGGVKAFLEMRDAAITIVDSHGTTNAGGTQYVVEAERHESTNVSVLTEYYNWLVDGQIGLYRAVKRNKLTKQPEKIVTAVTIWDTWFEKNIPSMPNNAAIFFYTCHSQDLDESPWGIFKRKGASLYFGFMGGVGDPWGIDVLKRYLDRVTGANIYDPWETDPMRRAQSFETAYNYLRTDPEYQMDPRGKGVPLYTLALDDVEFSAHPHIDGVMVSPFQDRPEQFNVSIWGAFGSADSSEVRVGAETVDLEHVDWGGGADWDVVVPLDRTGPLVVTDKWGRQSNPVMISNFHSEVQFKVDDGEAAGTVKLIYDTLVSATRLYRLLEHEVSYGGMMDMQAAAQAIGIRGPWPKLREYVLVEGGAKWRLEWDFNSTRRFGAVSIHAKGHDTIEGWGEALDDDKPDGFVTVSLRPPQAHFKEPTCTARVTAGATVGPIDITYRGPGGAEHKQIMVHCMGLPVECKYDQINGVIPAVSGGLPQLPLAGENSWRMSEVKLKPWPHDPDHPASLPDELRDAGRLAALDHLFAALPRG